MTVSNSYWTIICLSKALGHHFKPFCQLQQKEAKHLTWSECFFTDTEFLWKMPTCWIVCFAQVPWVDKPLGRKRKKKIKHRISIKHCKVSLWAAGDLRVSSLQIQGSPNRWTSLGLEKTQCFKDLQLQIWDPCVSKTWDKGIEEK